MIKMVLKDSTEISIKDGASIGNIKTECTSSTEVAALLSNLTKENCKEVLFKDGEVVTGNYRNLDLNPGSYNVLENGYEITISLRQKSDLEIRLEALEDATSTNDSAITDLADAVSSLMEG